MSFPYTLVGGKRNTVRSNINFVVWTLEGDFQSAKALHDPVPLSLG